MLRLNLFFLLIALTGFKAFAQNDVAIKILPETCITSVEAELFRLINEYRTQKGLPVVKLSASLSFVARTHAKDQMENFKQSSKCNMHSWSSKGQWSSCCYTADHKKAQCMWDKPRELTNYTGDGFEISFWSTYKYNSPTDNATGILNGWKKSPGHNNLIVNKSIWKDVRWNAIGIGIEGEYANVWFGKEEDTSSEPSYCD